MISELKSRLTAELRQNQEVARDYCGQEELSSGSFQHSVYQSSLSDLHLLNGSLHARLSVVYDMLREFEHLLESAEEATTPAMDLTLSTLAKKIDTGIEDLLKENW